MRIDLRNAQRERLFRVEIDANARPAVVKPIDGGPGEVFLTWDQAVDDRGHLRRCPACGCRELFVRKDFPQATGLVIVVLAAVTAMVLFGLRLFWLAMGVLAAVALVDAAIFIFAGRCLVCYRCRSEFRGTPIRKDQPGWDLATGEKYRLSPSEVKPGAQAGNGATP